MRGAILLVKLGHTWAVPRVSSRSWIKVLWPALIADGTFFYQDGFWCSRLDEAVCHQGKGAQGQECKGGNRIEVHFGLQ